ncbi:MAG: hypothetical protein HKN54_03160 [Flavobacteriaceae bacterium]|nr:hypothetical protein [Flavobacteriaceae bacterium]
MKTSLIISILLVIIHFNVNAQDEITSDSKINALQGEWVIDLRPTPQSEGYFQPFVIESIDGNTFKGTFYGSELEKTLLNDSWEKLYFAFTTRDSSNEYYHSGYLLNGTLFGITYCPNRNFTAPWTGERQ